jgi:hypothetical protein
VGCSRPLIGWFGRRRKISKKIRMRPTSARVARVTLLYCVPVLSVLSDLVNFSIFGGAFDAPAEVRRFGFGNDDGGKTVY